ncbi:1-aminocyclopropane-1-carboxylate deaminase [Flavobacterium sp. UMI-01]|nr:1-aminocyclopropane-1-carboxylate deaminase [Flavobacterium sp. UMI-01]
MLEAKKENATTLVTFGGAYSNHIAAVAFAGKEQHFKTIGVIRGEELATKIQENPTLKFAQECGMQFEFITREAYRSKDDEKLMTDLRTKWGAFYLIPEGGTNALAISGCEEILTPEDANFDYVCCAVGTGGTISGIINSVLPHQKVLGFPALKGDFLQDEISTFVQNSHWSLIQDYHFGGYGKVTTELIAFINHFYQKNAIPLDPIYTGKMMYGILDLIEKNYFPENSTILVIHTGGLQGVAGMNIKLKNKNLPLIQIHD